MTESIKIELPESERFHARLLNAVYEHQRAYREKPEAIILSPYSFLVWKLEAEQHNFKVYSNSGGYKWEFNRIRILVADMWEDYRMCHNPDIAARLQWEKEQRVGKDWEGPRFKA
jgi:hypothetical protein